MIDQPEKELVLKPIDAHGVGLGRPCPDNRPVFHDGANVGLIAELGRDFG